MREAFIHFLRYLCWAVTGVALVVVLLMLQESDGDLSEVPEVMLRVLDGHPFGGLWLLLLFGSPGGIALVLIRAGVGVASGADGGRADRMTAVGLGRFVLGGVVGLFVAHRYLFLMTPDRFVLRLENRGWLFLPFVLAGACAGVATGWLAWRRHGRVLLPVSWALVFVLLVAGWLALAKELMHQGVSLRL